MATASNSTKDEAKTKSQAKDGQAMGCIGRTQGDGMENVTTGKTEIKQTKYRLGDALIYHPTNLKQSSSIPPVTPMGPIINLVPKHIINVKDEKHILNSLKSKEPKFVPYEPYKAAVNPIIPYDKKNKRSQRSNLNMSVTVSQVAAMKIHDADAPSNDVSKAGEDKLGESEWLKEKKAYEAEIQKLKEENSQLENQLKFQAQVNGELKNLLVAAVGEDLETKVHLLTEDKLQLARALLNSAQHLSTHQEQTEWLAGQCEVWRSKFLASSLMVEELAKWKAALCQRTTDLQEAIKRLLEDRNVIRDTSLKTYRTLSILRENFDSVGKVSCKRHELPTTNILDLTQGCCQVAEILKVQLLSGVENISLQRDINITGLDMKTLAEKTAEQHTMSRDKRSLNSWTRKRMNITRESEIDDPLATLVKQSGARHHVTKTRPIEVVLMSPKLLMSGRQDIACSAVMGAAVAIGGGIFLPRCQSNITCCPHCSGEIKQI